MIAKMYNLGMISLVYFDVGGVVTEDYSLMEGFLKRFKVNPPLWSAIHAIKKSTSVGLLTNMYPGLLDAIKNRQLIPEISWDAEVDSSVVGYQKPDEEIYEIAERKAGVSPAEILFVENTEIHIEAAKQRGWQTFLYDPGNPEKSTKELELLFEF